MTKYIVRTFLFGAIMFLFAICQKRDHTSEEEITILSLAVTWIFEPLFMDAVKEWTKPKEIKK